MAENICLNNFKNKDYMLLSSGLNDLISAYWILLKNSINNDVKSNSSLIYELISILNLNDEVKTVLFENNFSYIGGYYNYEEKKLILSINTLFQLKKLNIISNNNFIVEYLTIIFHEIFHAIQYQYMCNYNDYLISIMKNISIKIKQNIKLNNKLHDLIPDEREASIESAKLLYYYMYQSKLLNEDERQEIENNLNFYLKNGYLYGNNIFIYPYQSISRFDNTVPKLDYSQINIYNKIIYGFNLENNPSRSLFIKESDKRLLYRKEEKI